MQRCGARREGRCSSAREPGWRDVGRLDPALPVHAFSCAMMCAVHQMFLVAHLFCQSHNQPAQLALLAGCPAASACPALPCLAPAPAPARQQTCAAPRAHLPRLPPACRSSLWEPRTLASSRQRRWVRSWEAGQRRVCSATQDACWRLQGARGLLRSLHAQAALDSPPSAHSLCQSLECTASPARPCPATCT